MKTIKITIIALALTSSVVSAHSSEATQKQLFKSLENGDSARFQKMFKNLKKRNTLVTHKDKKGDTLLHLACKKGLLEVVKMLVTNGANPNEKNKKEHTPLYYACEHEFAKIIDYLAKNKADLDMLVSPYDTDHCGNCKQTVLCYACATDKTGIALQLLEQGAHPNLCGEIDFGDTGNGPIHYATMNNNIPLIQALLDHDADINLKVGVGKRGETALHKACRQGKGNVELVEFLIQKGADVNAQEGRKETPLHYACREGFTDLVKLLIKTKASPNLQDADGRTALIEASRFGFLKIVKLLVAHGAAIETEDNCGGTAVSWAHEKGFTDIEIFLKSKTNKPTSAKTPKKATKKRLKKTPKF